MSRIVLFAIALMTLIACGEMTNGRARPTERLATRSLISVRSAVLNPEIHRLGVIRTVSGVDLELELRFGNDCLAEAGVVAIQTPTDEVNWLEIRQLFKEEGCPEIYQPVDLAVVVHLPFASNGYVLLDCLDPERMSRNRSCDLGLGDDRPVSLSPRLTLAPQRVASRLPAIDAIHVVRTPLQHDQIQLLIELVVMIPRKCADTTVETLILESRSVGADPVTEWTQVTIGANCDLSDSETQAVGVFLSRVVPGDRSRVMVLANRRSVRVGETRLGVRLVLRGAQSIDPLLRSYRSPLEALARSPSRS